MHSQGGSLGPLAFAVLWATCGWVVVLWGEGPGDCKVHLIFSRAARLGWEMTRCPSESFVQLPGAPPQSRWSWGHFANAQRKRRLAGTTDTPLQTRRSSARTHVSQAMGTSGAFFTALVEEPVLRDMAGEGPAPPCACSSKVFCQSWSLQHAHVLRMILIIKMAVL